LKHKTRFAIATGAALSLLLSDIPAQPSAEMHSASKPNTKVGRVARKSGGVIKVEAASQFGGPLPGLTRQQLAAFEEGLEEFQNVDSAESGLGPTFNDVSCAACHTDPAIGGSSTRFVTRFGRESNGIYDPLTYLGGSLLQAQAIDPRVQEVVPRQATLTAHRRTTQLFGLGLIEAIPDSTIIQNGIKNHNAEISGRAAMLTDVVSGLKRVGRFGWKAQQATILAFSADAYLNEMGITSRFFPEENAPNGNYAMLAEYDTVADPEDEVDPVTGRSDIDFFTDFMRFLAPPPALTLSTSAKAGQTLFRQIGCESCHTPTLYTGVNSIKALDRRPVNLYSDLLLHDMGALGDGIGQADAGPHEMKTPPLWGLRAQSQFLHDGRAVSVGDAILMHDGEGAGARSRYSKLQKYQQQQILQFLSSL
jgi:CxxC motif-containing protein (DUF1111 family)